MVVATSYYDIKKTYLLRHDANKLSLFLIAVLQAQVFQKSPFGDFLLQNGRH